MATGDLHTATVNGNTSNLPNWQSISLNPIYYEPPDYNLPPTSSFIYREEIKEVKGMRSLYKVYVVDPRKQGKVLLEQTIITEEEDKVLLKSRATEVVKEAGLELEQVDTFVECVGTFIRPRKETQKVRVVKEED